MFRGNIFVTMNLTSVPRLLAGLAVIAGCSDASGPRPDDPIVIAHRGASYFAPEHTLAAYDRALEEGADYIEQDIARTSDGVLVVIHDPTLDRTARGPVSDCTGPVREKTLAQLRQCDVGLWFNERNPARARPEFVGQRISTLTEVIARYRDRVRFYIEIKNPELYPGIEVELATLLRSSGLDIGMGHRPTVFVQSFRAESLKRLHEIDPEIPLIQLLSDVPLGSLEVALTDISTYAKGVGPTIGIVTESLIQDAHARCLLVHPYGAESDVGFLRVLLLGADGAFADSPELLRRAMETIGDFGDRLPQRC